MRLIVTFIACCFLQIVVAQANCSCSQELEFVIQYYEKNLPGFADNVSSKNRKQYDSFKAQLLAEATTAPTEVDCFKILTCYVEYFKDNHSRISMSFPNVDENNPNALQDFLQSEIYQSRETYSLSDDDLKQYPIGDIRGIYQTQDSSYTIAVIPSQGALRDYIGVIVDSKTKLWKKGQVKLELKATPEGSYQAFVYMRNHSLYYYPRYALQNGILGDGWFKTSKKRYLNHNLNVIYDFEFRKINDTTTYLRIPTFSGDYSAMIDSLYAAADSTIKATPNLIIDVRNNGGGSDSNVEPLLNYMYTNPIQQDIVDVYVTEDNLNVWKRWYEEAKQDPVNYDKNDLKWYKKELKRMKRAKMNSFVPRSKGGKIERKITTTQPKQVAIIMNKNCASSCETLLFWAKESKQTILVGENSGGFVGYGEVGEVLTPCFSFVLFCTMTRYQQQRQYEVVGIVPDYYLNFQEDWVGQTVQLLQKKVAVR